MTKRPLSVNIISVLLILIGFANLVSYSIVLRNGLAITATMFYELPRWVNFVIMYAGSLALLIGGMLVWKGKNIGRLLVVGWCVSAIVIYADYVIPRILYLFITVCMLFNKSANLFFESSVRTSNDRKGEH
ncbi:hypothetical protein [Paenibacillus sp. WLX2291]|uniref:hypothetical protein n=1 Tax=Paenibacillus sp. WLX2291 TaxID=3296934 RepID=UPI003984021E